MEKIVERMIQKSRTARRESWNYFQFYFNSWQTYLKYDNILCQSISLMILLFTLGNFYVFSIFWVKQRARIYYQVCTIRGEFVVIVDICNKPVIRTTKRVNRNISNNWEITESKCVNENSTKESTQLNT